MSGFSREEPKTVCKTIYTPIKASAAAVRSEHCNSRWLKQILLEKWWNILFCISDSSHCFSFIFSSLFFHSIPASSSSFPPPPPSIAAPPHTLLLLFPPSLSCQLPRRRCCHGYRAAGQISWCLVSFRRVHRSLSCMCAHYYLFFFPTRLICDPCSFRPPRALFFSFLHPLITSLQSVCSKNGDHTQLQWPLDLVYSIT